MHVGTSSGGSRLKPGTVPGHGWVERGSSQVIQSSIERSDLPMNCYYWVIECASFNHWDSFTF